MHRPGKGPGFFPVAMVLLVWGIPTARADLHFQESTISLGEVRTGAPLVQAFAFRNEGPEAVEIVEARASCGCLAPRLEKWVFRPGEAGVLRLEIHTLSQSPGPHSWNVLVRYHRGSAVEEKQLRIEARVVSEITVKPAALTVFADTPLSQDIVLTDLRSRHLTVTAVQTTSPALTAKLGDAGGDTFGCWSCKVHLKVEESFPPGRHEEAVHLYTSDPTYPDLKVPITVVKQLRQRVTAVPERAAWESSAGAPLPSLLVRLRDREDQAVLVEEITTDDPAVACRWAPGPGPMATLRIRVDHTHLPAGRFASAVHVRLRGPVRDTVTIPVLVAGP